MNPQRSIEERAPILSMVLGVIGAALAVQLAIAAALLGIWLLFVILFPGP